MKYILFIVSIVFLVYFIITRNTISYLEQENNKLKNEKVIQLKKQRDSLMLAIDSLTTKSKKRFDSILNLPPKIKYIKYEKPVYIDRTFDDAVRIISNYTYITREKDTIKHFNERKSN